MTAWEPLLSIQAWFLHVASKPVLIIKGDFSGSMLLSGRDPGFKQHKQTLVDLGPKETIERILNQA